MIFICRVTNGFSEFSRITFFYDLSIHHTKWWSYKCDKYLLHLYCDKYARLIIVLMYWTWYYFQSGKHVAATLDFYFIPFHVVPLSSLICTTVKLSHLNVTLKNSRHQVFKITLTKAFWNGSNDALWEVSVSWMPIPMKRAVLRTLLIKLVLLDLQWLA